MVSVVDKKYKAIKLIDKIGEKIENVWTQYQDLLPMVDKTQSVEDGIDELRKMFKLSERKFTLQKRLQRVYTYCGRVGIEQYYRLKTPVPLQTCEKFLADYSVSKTQYLRNLTESINQESKRLGITKNMSIDQILERFSAITDSSYEQHYINNFVAYSMLYHHRDKLINNNGVIELHD